MYGQFNYAIENGKLSQRLYSRGTASTYHIGEEISIPRAIEIALEQKADFAKAKVSYGVYTDCEGCSYNSVKWHDEYLWELPMDYDLWSRTQTF